jgi:hypothetical protein
MSELTLNTRRLGPGVVMVTTQLGNETIIRVTTAGNYCRCSAYRDLEKPDSGPLCPYCQEKAKGDSR